MGIQLAAPLLLILQEELASGNEIHGTTAWPPICELLVILKKKFRKQYHSSLEVAFAEINDHHYWQAEYRYMNSKQVLACGFAM